MSEANNTPDASDLAAPGDMDFPTFILSLATSVTMYLGLSPDPSDPDAQPAVNLPLARQSIDIIAMLKEKTQGNLTADEQQLIDQLLTDLRLRYVQATEK